MHRGGKHHIVVVSPTGVYAWGGAGPADARGGSARDGVGSRGGRFEADATREASAGAGRRARPSETKGDSVDTVATTSTGSL
jgi:hypothetical protein